MPLDKLNLDGDVWFFDDRAKTRDLLKATGILWSNGTHALFRVEKAFSDSDPAFNFRHGSFEPMLVEIQDGKTLNSTFFSWIATNDISWMAPAKNDG